MAAITLRSVSIDFPIYDSSSRSMKKALIGAGASMFRRVGVDSSHRVVVQALRDISLSLRSGDRVGLIGRNGAGKSTLLRVLTGIYEPCAGTVAVEGGVSAMTDITMGMDPDATGYQNIVIRGMFMGLSHQQIRDKVAEIEDFTELKEYLGLPIRTYSTGMTIRLAFAIATCVEPEILIMDELIGAGDAHFVEKARARVMRFLDAAHIVVLASHDNGIIRKFCNSAVLLHEGRILSVGAVDTVIADYEALEHAPAE